MKLESFLWYVSIAMIAGISLYAFYAYFSGQITGFGAFTLLLVTYATFGFLLGVASYLAGQRKAGWVPEEESRKILAPPRPEIQRESVLRAFAPRPRRYAPYRKALLAILAAGVLAILWNAVLGLLVVVMAAVTYGVLTAVELFEPGEG